MLTYDFFPATSLRLSALLVTKFASALSQVETPSVKDSKWMSLSASTLTVTGNWIFGGLVIQLSVHKQQRKNTFRCCWVWTLEAGRDRRSMLVVLHHNGMARMMSVQ